MPQRVALFIDYQNVYMGARGCFHEQGHLLPSYGQIKPLALGELICARPQPPGERVLQSVSVFTGRPSLERDPKGYAAIRRQIAAWERLGVEVFPRTLRYPANPNLPPQEKGIDVSLAIAFVSGAVDRRFDVGIIFSTDTDLVPALEFVTSRPELGVTVEVAAWQADGANRPLRVAGHHVWCHRLTGDDYAAVRDWRVYVEAGDGA